MAWVRHPDFPCLQPASPHPPTSVHPYTSLSMGVLELILLLTFMILIIAVLVALAVLVARLAVRQKQMAAIDEELLAEQLEIKRRARRVAGQVQDVQEDVAQVQKLAQDYTSGAGRTTVRVDSSTALSSVAPPTVEPFAVTDPMPRPARAWDEEDENVVNVGGALSFHENFVTAPTDPTASATTPTTTTSVPTSTTAPAKSPVLPPRAADAARWMHVTDATGKKYLPGGLASANLWARDGVLLADQACVSLGDGADAARVCGRGTVDSAPGVARIVGDGLALTPGAADGRTGRALGVDLMVRGGATSWYKLATSRTDGAAAFRVRATVMYAGAVHDVDVMITTTAARDAIQARLRTAVRSASAAAAPDLWSAFGLAVVPESGPSRVHLYAKSAPASGSDMAITVDVEVLGGSAGGSAADPGAQFHLGRAPINLAFSGSMTSALDATLKGAVGATLDVYSAATGQVTRHTEQGLDMDGGAVLRGGLTVSNKGLSTPVGPQPEGVGYFAEGVMIGTTNNAWNSRLAVNALPGRPGVSLGSSDGVYSHFPWKDGNTYIRPGAKSNAKIIVGDKLGNPEVNVQRSVFSELETGATRLRAAGADNTVYIGDDLKSKGLVKLGSAEAATHVMGPLHVNVLGPAPDAPSQSLVMRVGGVPALRILGEDQSTMLRDTRVVGKLTVDDQLCMGSTCMTAAQLQGLLAAQQQAVTTTAAVPPTANS